MGEQRVVAVAAPIGGGKSALVHALAHALDETHTLNFDHYEHATRKSGPELEQWLAEGADFDALEAPGLPEDLATLRGGGTIVDRITGNHHRCERHVVFEMPLGRAWSRTAQHIDVLIWVDVPLDVALARRVREIAVNLQRQNSAQMAAGLSWLDDYLGTYASTIHSVLEAQRRVVRPGADLVLDGELDVSSSVQQVLNYLGRAA
jgi:uridine kinase